jgi:hypothetical protein
MKVTTEYSRQQARCLHFDANGKKLSPASQGIAAAYDPWQVLKEMQAHMQEPGSSHTERAGSCEATVISFDIVPQFRHS